MTLRGTVGTFLLLAVVGLLFWYAAPLQELFFDAISLLEHFDEDNHLIAILIFIGLSAVAALLGPVGIAPLVPPAVVLWGSTETFVLVLLGWLIGAFISYALGYWGGYPLLKFFLSADHVESVRHFMERRVSFKAVLLGRLALPAELLGYGLGAVRYPLGLFAAATLIAEIVFAALTVYAGQAFITQSISLFVILVGVALAIIFISFRWLKKQHHVF
jgi:uncharacterized membrane protein YdjX (TVP38/TMEM64 family)